MSLPPSAQTPADAKQQALKTESIKFYTLVGIGGFLLILVLWLFVSGSLKGKKVGQLEADIATLQTEITKLKEEVATLEDKNRELATSASQANQKYKDLVGEVDEKQKMIDFLQKESSNTNKAALAKQKLAEETIENLKTQLADYKKEFEASKAEMEAIIQAKDEAIQSIKKSIK